MRNYHLCYTIEYTAFYLQKFQSYVFHLSIERAAMKTQHFANIRKEALAPFAPL